MNAHRPKITASQSPAGNLAGTVKSMSPAVPATFSEIGASCADMIDGVRPTGEAGAPNLSTVCPECEGTGFFVSGEFHPDDPRSSATWDCDNCGGTGEVDEPTWEEFAAPFRRLNAGWNRVEL